MRTRQTQLRLGFFIGVENDKQKKAQTNKGFGRIQIGVNKKKAACSQQKAKTVASETHSLLTTLK
ncbi:hypothetical protein [Vibrio variabilis]|uniref:hypothetical protein n=1 Tax=Vibrio variabilis TaxID=990271 RepID=UPI000DD56869|nr:hypothetical protein [Vibrio variabilis]